MKPSLRTQMGSRGSREGAALLTIMLIGGLVAAAAVTLAFISSSATHRVRKAKAEVQALYLAEAGVANMLASMRTNYYHWANNMVMSNAVAVGGSTGTYWATTKMQTNGNITVTGVGEMRSETRDTVLEVLGTETIENNAIFGTNVWILADLDITIATSATRIKGDVYSNQDVVEGPGDPLVDGNIFAVGTVEVDATGVTVPGAPVHEIPVFNFESYRQVAVSGGIYLEGDQVFHGDVLEPGNGVVYVNGNVRVKGNTKMFGCLVANGNIRIDNQYMQTQVVPYMPSLLATGHIDLNNKNDFYGTIYGRLSVDSWNRKTVYGSVISHGWMYLQNDFTVIPEDDYPIWDPLADPDPNIVVGGWLK